MTDTPHARDLPHVWVPSGIEDLCKCWRRKSDPIHIGGQYVDSVDPPAPRVPRGSEKVLEYV